MPRLAALTLATALAPLPAVAGEAIPAAQRAFLDRHCVVCHSGEQAQAELRLDVVEIEWGAEASASHWERVLDMVENGAMPPAAMPRPPEAERERLTAWLHSKLALHSGVGGTRPRRLNRTEFENTVRDLFDLPDFALPAAFPADDVKHGFDNVSEGLVLSPPLMAQYLEVATAIADEILPPDTGPVVAESKRYRLDIGDFESEGGGPTDAGTYRLVSSRNMASAAGWPARFEASHSGVYRIAIDASVFQTDKMFYERRTEPLRIALYARPKADQVYDPFGKLRKLTELEVAAGADGPTRVAAEVELVRGETFGIRWTDGPAYSDPPKRDYSHTFLADRLTRDRLFYAAMLEFRGGSRGTTESQLYDATSALMRSGTLDLDDPRLDKLPEVWGGGLSSAPHNWIKAFVHEEMYRFGPAVDVTAVEVEGPLRLIEDEATRTRKARTAKFLGPRDPEASRRSQADAVLRRFLPKAFRRPVSDEDVAAYAGLAAGFFDANPDARLEDGLHLALRRALVSPNFLFRSLRPGRLDDFDLASRLSYFLTSAPPDRRLAELAARGALSDPDVLEAEAVRLVRDPRNAEFVQSFTGQWLSTRMLRDIMPDPRLLRFFDPDRQAMIDETEMFFSEILRENLPVEEFIDPGFSYRSGRLNKIYGGDLEGNEMRRVEFARGGRHGGVLGLASVMMATANGVDTHPVLRGVWVLDNVLGAPVPEPPADVPALAPDTSGATTMRDQIQAHRADPSCARCHDSIDPLGMALENFDPVGRWRDTYPVYTKPPDGAEALEKEFYSTIGEGAVAGPPVDSVGILADGSRLEGATDLKRYVLERSDDFARGLASKLLVYASGRPLSYGDRRVVEQVVASNVANGNGFRDLIVAMIRSDSFRTK